MTYCRFNLKGNIDFKTQFNKHAIREQNSRYSKTVNDFLLSFCSKNGKIFGSLIFGEIKRM